MSNTIFSSSNEALKIYKYPVFNGNATTTDFTVFSNDYYDLVWDGTEKWWRFMPTALLDGIQIALAFTLLNTTTETYYHAQTPASEGVALWLASNPSIVPFNRYAAGQNLMSGYFGVRSSSSPFFTNFILNCEGNNVYIYPQFITNLNIP